MPTKTFWKCKVCGDIHFGAAGPAECPTCHAKNAYEATTADVAKKAMKF